MDSKLSTVTLTAPAASQHATCKYLKTSLRNLQFETVKAGIHFEEEDTQRRKISKQEWPSILQLDAWEVSLVQNSRSMLFSAQCRSCRV